MRELTAKQITKRNKAIVTLESAFGFKLSPEQLRIVKYNYRTPLLVNACAGSGKTTLLLFSIILAIITGQYKPQNILAITFSKKAQLDMKHRYQDIMWGLKRHGYTKMSLSNTPTFVTFHALFFRILRHFKKYQHVKVITSYTRISNLLKKVIRRAPKGLSRNSLLRTIFRVRTELINDQMTWNGYQIRDHTDSIERLAKVIKDCCGINDPQYRFTSNYYRVVRCYCAYKAHYYRIDFNDMKTLLLQEIASQQGYTKVEHMMVRYQLCYIDEFQDIDALQWVIMRKILSEKTLGRLVVIGDDDQSIYSFRGSDPSIILNFAKNFKDAKRMNLSTNYRTSGNVLSAVKPLIMSNKYRMPKKLNASKRNQDTGGIYLYSSLDKTKSSGDVLLHKLWKMIKDPKINNKDIVVLVRYNADLMLATDWLANRGFYVKTNNFLQKKSAFSQMNKIYKIYMNLMWALCCDSFSNMNNWSQAIGFTDYRKHINSILRHSYRRDYNHLSTYLTKAILFDRNSGLIYKDVGQKDSDLVKAFKLCHIHNRVTGRDRIVKGSVAFHQVNLLTSDYFHYMTAHKYMSGRIVEVTTAYLQRRLSKYPDILKYFHKELKKRNVLTNIMYDPTFQNSINMMTIHRSKGLQFKYVFLYNLSDQNVKNYMIAVDKLFTPHITRMDFLNKLLNCTKDQLAHINGFSKASLLYNEVHSAIEPEFKIVPYYVLRSTIQDRFKIIARDIMHQYRHTHLGHNYKKLHIIFDQRKKSLKRDLVNNALTNDRYDRGLQKQFNSMYDSSIQLSKKLEEERRLVYVGCTRAEKAVRYNVGSDSNPLLKELSTPDYHKMILTKQGRIIPLVEDRQRKVKDDEAKLRKIERKLKRDKRNASKQ